MSKKRPRDDTPDSRELAKLQERALDGLFTVTDRLAYWARKLYLLEYGRLVPHTDCFPMPDELWHFARVFLIAECGLTEAQVGRMTLHHAAATLRAALEERERDRAADAGEAAQADGPVRPNRFRWKGKEVRLQPQPWKLASFLWEKSSVEVEAVISSGAVWGGNEDIGDATVRSTIHRANQAFDEAAFPIHLSLKNGYISLTVSP
jgi:hypothetical protein